MSNFERLYNWFFLMGKSIKTLLDTLLLIFFGVLAAMIGSRYPKVDLFLIILLIILVLIKIFSLNIKSIDEPIKRLINLMNSKTSVGLESTLTSNLLKEYESGISQSSSVSIITNILRSFDMQNEVVNTVVNNLMNSVTYEYLIPDENELTQDVYDFIKKIELIIDNKYQNLGREARNQKIREVMKNLHIYRFVESPILCNFAILRDIEKQCVGYWYTKNANTPHEIIFLRIGLDHIASLEETFDQIKRSSWKQDFDKIPRIKSDDSLL